MKDFFWTLFALSMMAICTIITGFLILVVWMAVIVYGIIDWFVKIDGYSHDKTSKPKISTTVIKDNNSELDEWIETFGNDPLPIPYSPSTNPLYSKWSSASKSGRHSLRDKNGRFTKPAAPCQQTQLPITRYGTPTNKRFEGQ